MSRYSGVDMAVEWTVGYFRKVAYFKSDEMWQDTDKILKNLKSFAEKLETKLENGIDKQMKEKGEDEIFRRQHAEIDENSESVRTFRKEARVYRQRDERMDTYCVDLNKAVIETLKELGLPTQPAQYIDSPSKGSALSGLIIQIARYKKQF